MKIAIIGAGKLGMKVASVLLGSNHDITMMDINPAQLKRASTQMDLMTVNANAKDIRSLNSISISTFDYLIAVTDSDETNIVVAAFAKKLGCRKVLARVRDPEHMDQFTFIKETMNIDALVNPDLSITQEIFKYLSEKYTLSNGIYSTGGASLIEFKVARYPDLIGKTMPEIHQMLPSMLVAAISRNGKIIIPDGTASIMEGDSVYIMGKRDPIIELNTRVHERGKYTDLQRIMIIGGGKTGFYLAKKLSDFGMSVKIIERNLARCHYLSDHLRGVMVLNGDATDMTLLEDENLDQMDAVVTCTGFDEDNLLLALSAKSHKVKHVIAKVSRASYAEIITDLGIDMALNPLDITTSEIARFVQGHSRVLTSQIIQGQAEIMEFIASTGMKILGKPLNSLDLPHGILFAAIHRGDQVIIPGGNDIIQAGDRVTIIYLLSEISAIEGLISQVSRKRFRFFNL